jgi:hypothetical protein
MVAPRWLDRGFNTNGDEMAVTETTKWDGMNGQVVTVVDTPEVAAFLGVDRGQLRRRLRELRDQGQLVHDHQRLTKRRRVRDETARFGVRHVRCVVFKGRRQDFEKPRGRMRVIMW